MRMRSDMLRSELILLFTIGYCAIIFEKFLHVNKAAIALVMAIGSWLLFFIDVPGGILPSAMAEQTSEVAQIIFFLIAVMAIVELIDSHHGFKLITDIIYTSSLRKMLWFLIVISFFMSSILDNLTAMIVMSSLLKKMIKDQKDRWMLGSIMVISVNAGGAWTPIGDVTTTMLWINEKITTWKTIEALFIPSVVCIVVAGLIATFLIKKDSSLSKTTSFNIPMQPGARRVFFMGVGSLIMIPLWKALFGLPPFMGALIGLGLLWLVTDLIHARHGEERSHLRVVHILTKIDTSSILFFLGILLVINALATANILKDFAEWLQALVPNQSWVAFILGLASSVIDNVPLVAASMSMYDMQQFPVDAELWQLIAYAAGTGGSILIIGSAAGVAFMGLEKVDFLWYLRKISWIAFVGYVVGFFTYFLF